jgi:cobalt-zinc-cadmium efflux system protein
VVATSILIALTGELRLDPVIAGVIAVVICVGAVRLVREAVDVLLEAAPAGIALDEVSAAIRAVPGVLEVHDLHVWSITTGLPALSGHVRIDARSAADGDEMLARIKEILRGRFLIEHTTLQVETPRYQQPCEDHS